MKAKTLGSYITVNVSARDVASFNRSWPCADIPERACWFQFSARNGDFVDMSPHLFGDRFNGDGNALNALMQDAQDCAKKATP